MDNWQLTIVEQLCAIKNPTVQNLEYKETRDFTPALLALCGTTQHEAWTKITLLVGKPFFGNEIENEEWRIASNAIVHCQLSIRSVVCDQKPTFQNLEHKERAGFYSRPPSLVRYHPTRSMDKGNSFLRQPFFGNEIENGEWRIASNAIVNCQLSIVNSISCVRLKSDISKLGT
jgi:hypothetical protein